MGSSLSTAASVFECHQSTPEVKDNANVLLDNQQGDETQDVLLDDKKVQLDEQTQSDDQQALLEQQALLDQQAQPDGQQALLDGQQALLDGQQTQPDGQQALLDQQTQPDGQANTTSDGEWERTLSEILTVDKANEIMASQELSPEQKEQLMQRIEQLKQQPQPLQGGNNRRRYNSKKRRLSKKRRSGVRKLNSRRN